MVNTWKKILSQCGSHGGLRLIQNRLFATAGSYLSNHAIQDIKTVPENASNIDGNNLRFPIACEITNIELYGDRVYEAPINTNLYKNRDCVMPILNPNNNLYIEKEAVMSNPSENNNLTNALSPIIYDSAATPGGLNNFKLSNKSKLVKSVKSNGKDYFTIKRMGILALPMSMLGENKEYVLVITIKKLSGNGKAYVGINCGNESPSYMPIIADYAFTETRSTIKTGSKPFPGEFFKVNIAVLEDGTGEVLISRIVVIENNFTVTSLANTANVQFTHNPVTYAGVAPVIQNNVSNYVSLKCFDPYADGIKNNTKNSATIFVTRQELPESFDANIILEPLTYSSRQWVGKSYSLLRGTKIVDETNQITHVDKTSDAASLVFGSLGFLKPCARIFVEEWNTRQRPSEEDTAILSKCDTIITPSFINFQILKQLLPDKYILCMPRFWPAHSSTPLNIGRYYLYFEKFAKVTEMLVNCWKPTYQKLFVVGSTATLKENIQHISEYTDYSVILSYIFGAESIIDISDNTNYMSGINNIAIHNGVNLITNNLAYFANDYANVKFINSTIDGNANLILDEALVQSAIEARMGMGAAVAKTISANYASLFKENIGQLTGQSCG